MADKFVFSNFAVSSLQYDIDEDATSLHLGPDDVGRFPILSGGAKFPLVLNDDTDFPEIVYVTSLALSGLASIERGREGTTPRAWTAGTLAAHTFTAASVIGAAGLVPKGAWVDNITYNPGDIVLGPDTISYIAVLSNINSSPSLANPNWQVIYQPPGAASTAMNWRGRWSLATAYAVGQVVEHKGDLWVAAGNSTGSEPADGNANWTVLAVWGGASARQIVVGIGNGNNYAATIPAASAPAALYDGMSIYVVPGATNTGAATLNLNSFGAKALRPKSGADFASGDLIAGEVYQFIFRTALDAFQAVELPGFINVAGKVSGIDGRLITLEGDFSDLSGAFESLETSYNAYRAALAGGFVDYPIVAAPDPEVAVFCYGQAISRTTYARLFAKIGTTYGPGNGTTTFNVPTANGTVSICANGMGGATGPTPLAATVGTIVGDDETTLVAGNLPPHPHTFTGTAQGDHSHATPFKTIQLRDGSGTLYTFLVANVPYNTNTFPGGGFTPAGTIGNGPGTSAPFSRVQPSFVVHRAILV